MNGISISLRFRGPPSAARFAVIAAARLLRAYAAEEGGASAAEFAILLFVLCGCVIFGLRAIGSHASNQIQNVAHAIDPRSGS